LTRTFIESLALTNFRSHTASKLKTDSRHVVLVGPNGAGKTNCLEAVSLLTPGRGFRRASLEQLSAQTGAGDWAVAATVSTATGDFSVGTGIQSPEDRQRRVRINGASAKSADELLEILRIGWLVPAQDGLFAGPAGDRRRFLDRMVLALDPTHGQRVNRYDKAVRARNKLLDEGSSDDAWLAGIEQQISELGVAVAAARRELCSHLSALTDEIQESRFFPTAALHLEGSLEQALASDTAAVVEDDYCARLRDNRHIDRAAGRTLEGPHRSDLTVFHKNKNMLANQSSTGEQKALLIGLILAHARVTNAVSGCPPILLLDEVVAHLDGDRRAELFDQIDALGIQTWLTGTDIMLFESLQDRAQFFELTDGTIRQRESL
jgi:DNA replication and repair protein RecF